MGSAGFFEFICNIKGLEKESETQEQAYSKGYLFQGYVLNINALESSSKESFAIYSKKMAYSSGSN